MQGHESECPGRCCFPGCTEDCYSIDHDKGLHVCSQHRELEFKPETRIRVSFMAEQPEGDNIYLSRTFALTATLSADNQQNLERGITQMLSILFQNKNIQTGV